MAMAPDTQAWRIENGAMIVHAMNQTSNGGARCVRWEETIEATEPPEATDAGTMGTDAGLPNSGDNLDSGMP